MGTLREEYSKYKIQKNKAINEAAVQWVMENVLLLNETFNREALQRLQGSIAKFDQIFAPFAVKVPEVKRSLDDAVELMNRITMGEKITRSDGRLRLTDEEKESIKEPATYMVKYISILYNNLSRFFNKDMRVLVSFPIFKVAVDNPSTPLKDLAEAKNMRKAILHALVPSNETQSILGRMYRSMELPTLDYNQIADELLNLSVNDFKELMAIDKVPLVTTPGAGMEEATSTNPKALNSEEEVLTEEEQAYLNEIGEPNQLEKVNQGLQKISTIIKAFPELQGTSAALEKLRGQALSAASGGKNLLDPSVKGIAATANIVYNYFEKLGELWPKINQLIPEDRPMNDEELNQLQAMLNKGVGQNLFTKIANFFKSGTTDPALKPETITADIINVLRQGSQQNDTSTYQHLENFFTRLNSAKLPPGMAASGQQVAPGQNAPTGSQVAGGAQPSAAPSQPAKSAGPGTAQKSAPVSPQQAQQQAQQQQGRGQQQPNLDDLAQKVTQIAGGPVNNNKQVLDALLKSGWKIIPPQ